MRRAGAVAVTLLTGCTFRHGSLTEDAAVADSRDAAGDSLADGAIDSATCLTAPSGLVAFWPADGDALDKVGGHDGALFDDATATGVGKVGSAFSFDGNLDQVLVASPPQSTSFTIEAWIDIATSSNYRTIYAEATRGFWMRSGKLTWWQGAEVYASNGTVASGTFHHVALTYDGSMFIGYIDGTAQGSSSFTGATLPTTNATGIGGHNNEYVTGRIDEVSVYDRALLGGEITAIVAAGDHGKCR